MRNTYDAKTYTREEREARAAGLADVMMDALTYHLDEIAGDEPKAVRDRTLRILAKQLLSGG